MKPLLDSEGVQRTRRTDCVCGTSFQQSAILVEGWTDGGGPVERREIYVPLACPSCTRAKIRAAAGNDPSKVTP